MKLETTLRARPHVPAMLMLAVTALAVTACGGGGGSGSPMAQGAPNVSPFTSQSVNQDTPTGAVPFTVSDDGGADALTFTVSSSDPSIVSIDGITLAGNGVNRTVNVLPSEDATGRVNIMINAKDAQGNVGFSILPLTVNAVTQSITSYTNSTFAKDDSDTPVQVSGFTFVQDGDDDNTFASLVQ
jgi:hypothetical protein